MLGVVAEVFGLVDSGLLLFEQTLLDLSLSLVLLLNTGHPAEECVDGTLFNALFDGLTMLGPLLISPVNLPFLILFLILEVDRCPKAILDFLFLRLR